MEPSPTLSRAPKWLYSVFPGQGTRSLVLRLAARQSRSRIALVLAFVILVGAVGTAYWLVRRSTTQARAEVADVSREIESSFDESESKLRSDLDQRGAELEERMQSAFVTIAEQTQSDDEAVNAIYEKLIRSGVAIAVYDQGNFIGFASGALIDRERGLIITNYHVVKEEFQVQLSFAIRRAGELVVENQIYVDLLNQGQFLTGRVLARDSSKDLAVVQIDRVPDDAVALPLAENPVQVGDRVHSIGNGRSMEVGAAWIYSAGVIRQQPYHFEFQSGWTAEDAFAVSATIVTTTSPTTPGDSGGPMVNDGGELVAVTQGFVREAEVLSLFIDVSEVKAILQQVGP
jgi:S1-C subfamily serine protease